MLRTLPLLLMAACSPAQQTTPDDAIPAAGLMLHVTALAHDSMEGRRIGTTGSAKAQRYLAGAFRDAGLAPVGADYVQVFSYAQRDSIRRGGANIVGMVRGTAQPDQYIVVTAHYDHLGYGRAVNGDSLYNGADDNASGTAAIIEMGRWFARQPPRHSIVFVALDGEENGLQGARHFLEAATVPRAQIAVNVNLDMVGRNAGNVLFASGGYHAPFLRPLIDSVAAHAGITLRQGHDRPGVAGEDDWTMQSDHAVFHRAGIPFVYFGEEDHPDYHRPSDHASGIMPGFFAAATTAVLQTLLALDRIQNFPSR